MATAHTLCTGSIAGCSSLGKGRLLVSIQGDGLSAYDVGSQKPVLSWALGGAEQDFAAPAVYDYDTNLCFAPVRPRGGGGGGGKTGNSVLAWDADHTVGTITTLAHPLHLPPLHRVFPLSGAPEGEAAEAAAAAAEEAAAVDGSGARRGSVLAVLASGGAVLCSGAEVVAEAEEARGQHTVAAAYQPGCLVVVSAGKGGAGASASVYRVQPGALEAAGPAVVLAAPAAGARAAAAAATPERTAVLWSDGTVAVYALSGDQRPLAAAPGQSADPGQPLAQRRLAGFRLAGGSSSKQPKGSGSGGKKRGAGGEPEAAAGGVSMAAIGAKQVAVAGWATDEQGATVLRLVVLETSAGCVQLAQDFTAADVGLAVLDPSKPVQVESLGGEGRQLALGVGTAVLIATLHELRPPTLANLLGALAIDKALAAARGDAGSSSASQGGGSGALPAPAPAGDGAAAGGAAADINPAAFAALRALHADEVQRLAAPFGGAACPMELQVDLEAPSQPGQWLAPASRVTWRPADQAAHEQLAAEERRAWQAAQQGELRGDRALQQALAPLLELRRSSGVALSPRLVCRLLALAAERQCWGAVEELLQAQAPALLSEVPGLAAALADAGQLALCEQLLAQSCELPAAELAALLQVLLSPPSSSAARKGRQARQQAARAAADAATAAAEEAEREQSAQQQQQQQQQQQAPAAASKPSRRRRKKGAADAGDSDAEDAAGAAASEPCDAAVQQADAASGELAWPPAAARQAAVAACCAAAVDGLEVDDVCLHAVVAAPVRPAALLEALRSLAPAQAVRLLRYLSALLASLATRVGNQRCGWQPALALPPAAAPPTLGQALEWANAAIDGHLVRLSLDPEAAPLLRDLGAVVEAAAADTKALLKLTGVVEHVVQQRPLPQAAAAAADYSIQWLDLRIAPAQQGQQAAAAAAQ